jgi:hypothetical protein
MERFTLPGASELHLELPPRIGKRWDRAPAVARQLSAFGDMLIAKVKQYVDLAHFSKEKPGWVVGFVMHAAPEPAISFVPRK